LTERFYKLSVGIQQIDEYRMINEIIPIRVGVWWCGKVNAVSLADRLDLFVVAGESDKPWVEIGEVTINLWDRITSWID
jgi:hypothetical protein